MSKSFSVEVHGISYDAFAQLKWKQFLRWFSLAVLLLVIIVASMTASGRLTQVPATAALVLILVVFATLAIYRSSIRQQHRRSGLSTLDLQYTFDRDGWTVRSGRDRVRVLWKKTWRVCRSTQSLMLYPNRQSVNLVPLKCLSEEQIRQIVLWYAGKTSK